MESIDAQRLELERALELLGRNTRLGRLLKYLGEKHFQNQEGELTEFNIATEVFGRSADRFDAGEDAVVRVEVHRLRKRLREIYEKSGGAGGLQIALPGGTYAPHFSRFAESKVVDAADVPTASHDAAAMPPVEEASTAGARPARKWPIYVSVAVGVLSVAVVGTLWSRSGRETESRSRTSQPVAAANHAISAGNRVTEVHIMAGYGGSEVIDNSGVRWTPDRFVSGGAPWQSDGGFVGRTSRPFLFANWRNGEFSYDIPVEPGVYELRLLFVSPMRAGDERLAGFNIAMNGKPFIRPFDINIDGHGADVADERVFRDVAPGEDGFIRVGFTNQVDKPWLNALELVPGIPGRQRPVRITTQPTSFVDHTGQRWRADDYFLNGVHSTEHRKVSGTEDSELFNAERYGHFSYAIPVDTRGTYTVVLHFVEFYFGPQMQGGGGVGSRVFHVFCNGKTLLENFDIYEEGGSLRVVTKSFRNIKPSAQGKINLEFEPVANNATVSGIEIIDESE